MEIVFLSILLAGFMAKSQECPTHCSCQNLSPSLSTVCAKIGLLFVPTNINRQTVELRLGDNFITTVRKQDFANMSLLADLTLSRNTISHVTPTAFADLTSLTFMHLDYNRLTNIADDVFHGLSSLRHLIISNNQLNKVSEGAFDYFLTTLEDLDLAYNNLVYVPWDAIAKMTALHTLSLDHNMIDHIVAGTFTHLHKLARLDMTSNKLQKLPPDPLFSRLQRLTSPSMNVDQPLVLRFGGNPLHCNCELLWLRRLTHESNLETCASPQHLVARYFWSIPEHDFVCDKPLITHHTAYLNILEGQRATFRCRAIGDPEPLVHWAAPDERVLSNSTRLLIYDNGTLDILVTTTRDDGKFTCIASNPAGEATASIRLSIIHLPHVPMNNNSMHRAQEPDPGLSDITGSAKSVHAASAAAANTSDTKAFLNRRVLATGVTSSSAVIKWSVGKTIWDVKMYQLQYNSSADDTLMYRMLPAISKMFILNNLLAGTLYDLCVVAIYDDAATSLTATHILGCLQFSTDDEYIRCSSLPGDFIGGTMIIIIGGIIVFSLLVFIIILMIRYRVCAGDQTRKVSGNGGNNESWPLDLGQPGPSQLLRFQSDLSRATDEPLSRPCQRSHQALLTQWPEKDPPQICAEKGLDPEQQEQQLQESRRHRFSCRLIVQDESQPSSEASTRSQSFASSHYFHDSRDGPLVALGGSSKVQPSLSVWEKQGPWVAIDQPGWPEQREQGSEEEEGEEEDDEVEEEEEGEEEEEQEGDGRNQQCTNLASQSRQTGISQGDTELALSKVLFTSANSGPRRSLSFDINVLSHRESFNKAKASLQPKRSLSINGLVVCFEETRPSNGLTYAGSEWMPESSV